MHPSRLVQWLKDPRDAAPLLGVPPASLAFARASAHWQQYLTWGGMPALVDPELEDIDRREWLVDYRRTYLERDVTDLAALRDLEPFVRAQRAAALRSGTLINFSDLARSAQVTPDTARRFLRYLELSYQVLVIEPYHRNPEERLTKMPKLHFVDPGVLRAVINRWGEPTGEMFESAVAAEVHKQLRNAAVQANLFHLRTYDGREVDLLVELEDGFVAIEIKAASTVTDVDGRHLRNLQDFLDRPLLGSLLISMDRTVRKLDTGAIAVPAAWALGPAVEDA